MIPQVMLQMIQEQAGQRAPTGFRGMMNKPGVGGALQAMGAAMMAQSDRPGQSFLGNLGRSVQPAMQAYQGGQQDAEWEKVLSGMNPQMRTVLSMAPPGQRAQIMLAMQPKTPEAQFMNTPDGIVRVQDGQEAQRVYTNEVGTEGGPSLSDISTMQGQFNSLVGDFDEIARAYAKIQEVGTGTPSAAGDLSLIFSYMKVLDPGSSVREGEQATAQNARGVPSMIRSVYNRLMTGETLEPDQRKDFVSRAKAQVDSQLPIFRSLESHYRGKAERAGIDPRDVIRDPFSFMDPFSDLVPR